MCKHVQAPVLLGHISQATHLRPTGHNGVEPLSHGTTPVKLQDKILNV